MPRKNAVPSKTLEFPRMSLKEALQGSAEKRAESAALFKEYSKFKKAKSAEARKKAVEAFKSFSLSSRPAGPAFLQQGEDGWRGSGSPS